MHFPTSWLSLLSLCTTALASPLANPLSISRSSHTGSSLAQSPAAAPAASALTCPQRCAQLWAELRIKEKRDFTTGCIQRRCSKPNENEAAGWEEEQIRYIKLVTKDCIERKIDTPDGCRGLAACLSIPDLAEEEKCMSELVMKICRARAGDRADEECPEVRIEYRMAPKKAQ